MEQLPLRRKADSSLRWEWQHTVEASRRSAGVDGGEESE